jgi:hypothetical protein
MLFAPKCKDRINNAIEILLILARITYFTSIIPRVFSSAKEEEGSINKPIIGAL